MVCNDCQTQCNAKKTYTSGCYTRQLCTDADPCSADTAMHLACKQRRTGKDAIENMKSAFITLFEAKNSSRVFSSKSSREAKFVYTKLRKGGHVLLEQTGLSAQDQKDLRTNMKSDHEETALIDTILFINSLIWYTSFPTLVPSIRCSGCTDEVVDIASYTPCRGVCAVKVRSSETGSRSIDFRKCHQCQHPETAPFCSCHANHSENTMTTAPPYQWTPLEGESCAIEGVSCAMFEWETSIWPEYRLRFCSTHDDYHLSGVHTHCIIRPSSRADIIQFHLPFYPLNGHQAVHRLMQTKPRV